jgi:hypothetical protein
MKKAAQAAFLSETQKRSVAATVSAVATATTTAATATGAGAIGAAESAVLATATAVAAFATTATEATTTAAATTTVATAAAFTTTTATEATTTAAAKAAGGTRFHRTRLVDHNAATAQRLAVHALDGCLGFCIRTHFDKAKTFGTTGVALHHDFGAGDGTELPEGLFQIAIANRVGQIAHIQLITHEKPPERDSKKTHSTR